MAHEVYVHIWILIYCNWNPPRVSREQHRVISTRMPTPEKFYYLINIFQSGYLYELHYVCVTEQAFYMGNNKRYKIDRQPTED